jgi:hypothetical protein
MKRPVSFRCILLLLLLTTGMLLNAQPLQGGCALKDLIVKIDFGRSDDVQDLIQLRCLIMDA